jgi:hypothetical protein
MAKRGQLDDQGFYVSSQAPLLDIETGGQRWALFTEILAIDTSL